MGVITKISNQSVSNLNQVYLIWDFKHLIRMFFLRDLKIKYSQTKFKLAWIILQPLLMMVVFSFFFGYILKWKTLEIPYPIYVFSGLIIWNLFQLIIQTTVPVYYDNSILIKNNNFPKIALIIAKILNAIADSIISIFMLIVMMILFNIWPSWRFLFLALPIIITTLWALSIVLFAITFSYKKRDFLLALPYLVSFIIWVTPIFFTSNILPPSIKLFIYFNPIAGIVDLWRACLFSSSKFDFGFIPILIFTLPMIIISFIFYCQKESQITDHL